MEKNRIGDKSVGEKHIGEKSVGEKHVGKKPVGEKHLGKKPVGEKHPCGVISGPCFVQKSWFRTAQAIQNSRKMCSKNQWISDVKVLKTCVLAHSVCIC